MITSADIPQIDLALVIHENYRPRMDARGRWRFVRRDDGTQVTFPRSEYFIAHRDICKVAMGKPLYSRAFDPKHKPPRKMECPVDPDDFKYCVDAVLPSLPQKKASPPRELRWSNPDDRNVLSYRKACARLKHFEETGLSLGVDGRANTRKADMTHEKCVN